MLKLSIVVLFMAFLIIRVKDEELWFCCFFFLSSLGSHYNELYQIANSIVIADIGLLIFLVSYLLNHIQELYVKKETMFYFMIAMYMLLLGLIGRNEFGIILRDLKVFIYFFIPYIYCKKERNNLSFQRKVIITSIMCVIFTITVCSMDFFMYGIFGIEQSGKIDRTFGLGLSQYGLVIAFIVIYSCIPAIKSKFKKIVAILVLVICLFLCLVSYTRSVWIQFILSITTYVIMNFINNKNKISINYLLKALILTGILVAIFFWGWKFIVLKFPLLATIITDRMASIAYTGTGVEVNGNVDTFEYRMNDIYSYAYKFESPRIICGWGFGDIKKGAVSGIIENSFLYYSWKYGIILFILLMYKVINKLLSILHRGDNVNVAIATSLAAYFLSGGMSGHLNKYYMLPLIAIFMAIDFSDYKKYDLV